jgi:uncharacterized protein YuzE
MSEKSKNRVEIGQDDYTIWMKFVENPKIHANHVTEELNFQNLTVLLDRDKNGDVFAIEIVKP